MGSQATIDLVTRGLDVLAAAIARIRSQASLDRLAAQSHADDTARHEPA